jgi:hypothetical protein
VLGCALENGSLLGAAELAWQPVLDDSAVLDACYYPPPGWGGRCLASARWARSAALPVCAIAAS